MWRRINVFEAIVVVKGSGLDEADIRRAGIYRASQIIVLAATGSMARVGDSSRKDSGEAEALVDSDAIFTFQSVKKMNEQALIVLEIVRHQNVGYITNSTANEDYKFSPLFASGMLFTSSFLDALVCQSFYNPKIIRVLNELISGVDGKIMNHKLKKKTNLNTVESSSLYQIPIPDNLESKTYGSLYKHLSKQKMIPCGLYRGIFPQTRTGPKHNSMPYVFTNPSRDTELFSCDKVFVFSQNPITNTKSNSMELAKEIIYFESIRGKHNIAENTAKQVETLSVDMKELKDNSQNIYREIESLKSDLLSKVDALFTKDGGIVGSQTLRKDPSTDSTPFKTLASDPEAWKSTLTPKGSFKKDSFFDKTKSSNAAEDLTSMSASVSVPSTLRRDGIGGYRASSASRAISNRNRLSSVASAN